MFTPQIIDGRLHASQLTMEIKKAIGARIGKNLPPPGLAVLRIGDHPASLVYVTRKRAACHQVGVHFKEYVFPQDISLSKVLKCIDDLNQDPFIHGILIQLPLPSHLSARSLLQSIDPSKDVDGLHDLNMGRLWNGAPLFIPCTPKGCMRLLKTYASPLEGQKAVVLGRSQIVGRPLAHLLTQANCTVTVIHSHTREAPEICQEADIVVSAIGQPHFIKSHWIKPGAVVLDVGISRLVDTQGKITLRGDVDFHQVLPFVQAISPVPGGVGPMTIASLLENCLQAAEAQDPSSLKTT